MGEIFEILSKIGPIRAEFSFWKTPPPKKKKQQQRSKTNTFSATNQSWKTIQLGFYENGQTTYIPNNNESTLYRTVTWSLISIFLWRIFVNIYQQYDFEIKRVLDGVFFSKVFAEKKYTIQSKASIPNFILKLLREIIGIFIFFFSIYFKISIYFL